MTINNQFLEEYEYIVQTIAKQYSYLHMEEDLLQEGRLGLIEAGRKYAPTCGVLFESYAAWWVRKYIKEAVRRYGYILTLPERKKKDDTLPPPLSFDQPLYEEDGDIITLADTLAEENHIEEMVDRDILIEKTLESLSPRQREVVQYYYGIDAPQLTVDQIAEKMGLKYKNVFNLLERGIKKAKKYNNSEEF